MRHEQLAKMELIERDAVRAVFGRFRRRRAREVVGFGDELREDSEAGGEADDGDADAVGGELADCSVDVARVGSGEGAVDDDAFFGAVAGGCA